MDITKAVKTGKVKPAYITDKEKSLLLARDRAKGAISEKFYKGIPVLFAGEGDPDDPSFDGEPGEVGARSAEAEPWAQVD